MAEERCKCGATEGDHYDGVYCPLGNGQYSANQRYEPTPSGEVARPTRIAVAATDATRPYEDDICVHCNHPVRRFTDGHGDGWMHLGILPNNPCPKPPITWAEPQPAGTGPSRADRLSRYRIHAEDHLLESVTDGDLVRFTEARAAILRLEAQLVTLKQSHEETVAYATQLGADLSNCQRRATAKEEELARTRESHAQSVEKLAHAITSALFTNGMGQAAERLVLELPGKRDGGGWCRKAVEDVIIDKLDGK